MLYRDMWYQSQDGLRLYARDYQAPAAQVEQRPTVLCWHGLTRNSADFGPLCDHLSDRYRLIAVDQRGRGRSDYDANSANYHPVCYVQDMLVLIDKLALAEIVIIGTSLGGLMAMMLASLRPGLIRASVLNDVGPEVNPVGLARIKNYVSKPLPSANWAAAAAATKAVHGSEFPNLNNEAWLQFTRQLYTAADGGQLQLAYDPAIAEPMEQAQSVAVPPDLWEQFRCLAAAPILLLRGQISDILSLDTVAQMRSQKPDMLFREIPACGHAPMLTEPESVAAIDSFLDGLFIHRGVSAD